MNLVITKTVSTMAVASAPTRFIASDLPPVLPPGDVVCYETGGAALLNGEMRVRDGVVGLHLTLVDRVVVEFRLSHLQPMPDHTRLR